ncbi:wls [Acrasis kona]|uniref:Wls n=1 Tax=Acrasis kona TaxID=1008807 RepID=A0AAW2YIP3_9EUKA
MEDDLNLDKIEVMFMNKLRVDTELRKEVEGYAKQEWYENYLALFDKIQKYNDTPDLHSKKRSMVVEMYQVYVNEDSEQYILIRDDWRGYMDLVASRLLQDEKSTTKEENNTLVKMLENLVVKRLMSLFANCCLKSKRIRDERNRPPPISKSSTWTNLLSSFGRKKSSFR